MKFITLSTILGLAGASAAALTAVPIIEKIAPKSKSCPSSNTDCRTAEQAAPFLINAFKDYDIYDPKMMAAVLALMAFESGDFQYKRNQVPGRPGQGTANMQMANFNLLYAKAIPELAPKFEGVDSVEGMSDDDLNKLLDAVTVDKYNFASGAWFLATQCKQDVKDAFKKDADEGFKVYIEECVGTEVEPRLEVFGVAKEAFGL
ncbi:hypothetical protein FVEN_g1210 [Fusarium venenatum]|uniref:Uncharacterized protein n=1 Tax=Fusarium venenatum TaxID=56646 RepID=A0A2L2TJR8_9HYPO|nr:uncharacterized protein FVRRES_10346 [Fusarium venenatum]KAG8361653.1 hypothetical protein FVEN_g1210 [Fusarium venenatum]CEI70269.1 unnamed protein product [Fusarium venenatum]